MASGELVSTPTPGSVPATKAARHARIVQILGSQPIHSQAELAKALAEDGLYVTQATLSRDLIELRAEKVRDESGGLVYSVAQEGADTVRSARETEASLARLARLCAEMLISAESSGSFVVLRTPPGAAQYFGSVIDTTGIKGVMGTIAGDDTVLVIAREGVEGKALAARFVSLASEGLSD